MTQSKEFLAGMFHTYSGAKVAVADWKYDNGMPDAYPIASINANSICIGENKNGIDMWIKISDCRPILTPLSEISDVDAFGVAKIYGLENGGMARTEDAIFIYDGVFRLQISHSGYVCIRKNNVLYNANMTPAIDYLRSPYRPDGTPKPVYDCGYRHIRNLIDAGLAVKSEKI